MLGVVGTPLNIPKEFAFWTIPCFSSDFALVIPVVKTAGHIKWIGIWDVSVSIVATCAPQDVNHPVIQAFHGSKEVNRSWRSGCSALGDSRTEHLLGSSG